MDVTSNKPAHRHFPMATIAAALLALGLGACGGGGGDAPAAGGTPVSTPPPAASSPTDPSQPAPTNPPVVAGTCDLPNFKQELLDRINALRASGATCGSTNYPAVAPVVWNDKLTQAADGHALDMATKNYFEHDSQDGRTFVDRINAVNYGWSAVGENIAAGQTTVASVMTSWRNSAGHCANLMSANFVDMGVACRPAASSANAYSKYWVMDLGKPR
ncbi:CAP domain-containing protein [Mitsuaria sp. GD03876]|uniref:CAP domain-containing protein n=1 Tax=Mitsuaria sp. GD03876 TaxID=2975399 RepID=UPI0024489A2A|nr:CAP domain-containing protein [Mitsuaria sp. GD03876]MDH0864445.1 CAP domain-containing protein [Mitsuaria sp. GD03876]